MYLTYEEYEDYGGTLDETIFNSLCYEAESFINWVTFDRLTKDTEFPEPVKRCTYELIALIYSKRKLLVPETLSAGTSGTEAPVIKSMSNDGVSVTYSVLSANQLFNAMQKDVGDIISRQLGRVTNNLGRRLLYRGLYPDE